MAVVPSGQVVAIFGSDGSVLPIDRLAIVSWDGASRPVPSELILYSAEGEPHE